MKVWAILALIVPLLAAGCDNYSSAKRPIDSDQSGKPNDPGYPADWVDQDPLHDFSLLERSGKPFHSKGMDGKVWVVSMFFASCPTTCVRQNEQIQALHSDLAPLGVTQVSITCDPETDTPARLREYAHRFTEDSSGWLFLTGEDLHVRLVSSQRFNLLSLLAANPSSAEKYSHSSDLVVVDKWGNVRDRFNWQKAAEIVKLKQFVTALLAETDPPELKQTNGVRYIEQDAESE